ncbi:hypothetical protein CQ009_06760 [Pseudomonas sp. MYb2]|nr:hypothetical protein AK821_21335 [Pseudomonas sp. RIT-PI-r]PRB47404.1 hypothetical protein CQ025_17610 [Pseudomonas sp. MYb3]PRC36214.1 hypothetical protein CQ009_06760 [Pseudomonas sp. MYb2]
MSMGHLGQINVGMLRRLLFACQFCVGWAGPFASRSNRRTVAPTWERIPNVGATVRRFDLLAKAIAQMMEI